MQTITLKIDDSISDKFLKFLNNFKESEITILENSFYKSDDEYLKSIKGMEESIIKASKEPLETFVKQENLEW